MAFSIFVTYIAFHVVSAARPGRDFEEFQRHSLDLKDDIQPSRTEAANPDYVLVQNHRMPSECKELTEALGDLGILGEGDPCSWEGVNCSSQCQLSSLVRDGNMSGFTTRLRSFRHLETLKLRNAKVSGPLKFFKFFKGLRNLDLSGTEVFGNIAGLHKLHNLEEVNLHNTKVTGSFRSLKSLENLRSLDLSNTQTGGDLESLGDDPLLASRRRQRHFFNPDGETETIFHRLRYLDLSGTEVTGDLRHLKSLMLIGLHLRDTNVTGEIMSLGPTLCSVDLSRTQVGGDLEEIRTRARFRSLEALQLENTNVQGSIESLVLVSRLKFLDLAGTKVVGDFTQLQHLNLQVLKLARSGVHGSLPMLENHRAFTGLERLDLDSTRVVGNLNSLQKRTGLRGLYLRNTHVVGDVSFLRNLTQLLVLGLSRTEVAGDVGFFRNMTRLQLLQLKNTQVVGDLGSLHQLQDLRWIGFSSTKVTGDLKDLRHFKQLESARLNNINMKGDLAMLEQLTSLQQLDLDRSNVFGDIRVLKNFQALKFLDLSYTQVSGDVKALGHLTGLETVHLTGTEVTGSLTAFQDLIHLDKLNLQGLHVDGELSSLQSIKGLQLLRLQGTDVTGEIDALSDFKHLKELHLSNTKVYGNVKIITSLPALETVYLQNTQVGGLIQFGWWWGYCLHLKKLNLADTKVGPLVPLQVDPTFSTQKALLPALNSLNVSGCFLNGSIQDFVLPLAGSGISEIMASGCALRGKVPNVADMSATVDGFVNRAWRSTLSQSLQTLDLSSNSLTAVPAVIASIRMDLRNNKVPLKVPAAMITQTVEKRTVLLLENTELANRDDLQPLVSDELRLGELYTKDTGGFSCRELANPVLQVTPKIFLPRHMCECLPGYTGFAPFCLPCSANTYSSEMNSQVCHPCPRNSTAAPGSASCVCDIGTITKQDDTWRCECRIGEAFVDSEPGQERCESCQKLKLDCPIAGSNASTAAVLDGYARLGGPNVYQCLDSSRCLSSGCAGGYTGRLCSDCGPQHHESFRQCKPCTELENVSVGRVVLLSLCGGGAAALLGAATWTIRRKLVVTSNLRLKCAVQLLAPLLAALLQLVQLWSVLGRLRRQDVPNLSNANTTVNSTSSTENSQGDLWASSLEVLQLTATDLQGLVAIQCLFDAQTVRLIFAVVTPLVPLGLLLACCLVELVSRGTGIQVGLQLLTILFIGGASGAVRLLDCRRLDGTGKISLGDFAFRRLMPHLLCTEAPWVDLIGRTCAFCYGVLIPSFLAFLFAKQHLVMRQTKTFVAYHEGSSQKMTLRLQMISSKEHIKDDWKEKRLVAAAAVYVSVHVTGQARVTLLKDENAVTVEQLQVPDSTERTSSILESDLSVDLLVPQSEEAAVLRSQGEIIRHKTLVQMLTERSILAEMQLKRSDRIMLGAKHIFCKYASCQFVWMEICLKLASAALVSVVGSEDGIWLSIAITVGMALMVGLAQPFARPQQNTLYTFCFGCLAVAAVGFYKRQPLLSHSALLLPVLPLIISLARPDSQEALAMRLQEELEQKIHDGPVEVSARRVQFF